MPETKNLKSIAEIYKSDKIEHQYIKVYESYFEKIRDKNLKILEIGIADGKSLLTWSDYFKNSIIVGIDIHKINIVEKKLNRNNIEVHQGSQSDQTFIQQIISKYKEFDIIIDDGSHNLKDLLIGLKLFFKFVKYQGIYIIEDFKHPNYYEYNNDINHIFIDEFLKNLSDKRLSLSSIFSDNEQISLMNSIEKIESYKGNLNDSDISFITKK